MPSFEIMNRNNQSMLLFDSQYSDSREIYRLFKKEYPGCWIKEIHSND